MVNELNLTFKKAVLLSVLCVLLGVGMIYGISYEFQPAPKFTPPLMAPLYSSRLLVYAYDGDNHSDGSSFVQASVTITGPHSPITMPVYAGNNSTIVKTFVNETYNGTTTTDPQSPLLFWVLPGEYSVVATYGLNQPHIETLNVTPPGGYCDLFLNFGSVPLPPLGHIIVTAWYTGNESSPLVQASITISGPESHGGTTTPNYLEPLVFTVAPGEYTVVGTYGSAQPQTKIVKVIAGRSSSADLIFG